MILLSLLINSNGLYAVGLTIPENDPLLQDSLNTPAEPELTPAELATPPVGQIQKSHLRTVNQLRSIMTASLAAVPSGADGTGSPWFTKAQTYKTGLDTVATSSLQVDCFALIPKIAALLAARKEIYEGRPVPDFTTGIAHLGNGFSTVLIHAIERHIIDQNAVVSVANVKLFCTVYSIAGFRSEGDWEASPIPVNSGAVMILDPITVVAYLKTRPWREADQFIANSTSTYAFSRYTASGNGMAVLKTKYAANQVVTNAKWNELSAWLATQRPPE